jgi:hypothetical protein
MQTLVIDPHWFTLFLRGPFDQQIKRTQGNILSIPYGQAM